MTKRWSKLQRANRPQIDCTTCDSDNATRTSETAYTPQFDGLYPDTMTSTIGIPIKLLNEAAVRRPPAQLCRIAC